MIDKDIFANADKATDIGMKRRKYSSAFIEFSADDFTESFSYLNNIGRSIEFSGQSNGLGDDFGDLIYSASSIRTGSPACSRLKIFL